MTYNNLFDFWSPAVAMPFAIIMLALIAWALWETLIRDIIVPKVKFFFGLQHFKRTRKKYLTELKQYAMADLAATQQLFSLKKGPRHLKERRPRHRIPRHSATIAY